MLVTLNSKNYRDKLHELIQDSESLYIASNTIRLYLYNTYFTGDSVQITTVPFGDKSVLLFGYKDHNNFDWDLDKTTSPSSGLKKLNKRISKLANGLIATSVDIKLLANTEIVSDLYDFVEPVEHTIDVLKTEILFNIFLYEYIQDVNFKFDTVQLEVVS